MQSGVVPPNPIAASPAWSNVSACAGYSPPFNISTPADQKTSQSSNPGSEGSPSKHAKAPSSPGSSASSTAAIAGGGGGGGSPRGSGWRGNYNGIPLNRSVGVGSGFHTLFEKDVYRSKDLNLLKIEQLPSSASAFCSWRSSFLTKTCGIDAAGENVILTWLTEALKFRNR